MKIIDTKVTPQKQPLVLRQTVIGIMFACGLIGAASIGAASAATTATVDAPSITVTYDERSLATDAGVRKLYQRILRASVEVCPDASSRDLRTAAAARQCQQQSIARAIHQINNPRLVALYATSGKSG